MAATKRRKISHNPETSQRAASTDDVSEEYVEDVGPEWQVRYPKMTGKLSKAEQSLAEKAVKHESPFHANNQAPDALDTHYIVEPQDLWGSMRKYTKFIITGDEYTAQDFVWVRPSDDVAKPDGSAWEEKDYWVARILEIRAKDASHVYAQIAWLYWPEELPLTVDGNNDTAKGRRPYHGKYELIASNHMEVLDVTTFASKAMVEQWMEQDEEQEQKHLYWRQTIQNLTGRLSELRRHCYCNKYYNADLVMLECSKESCKSWLHTECLVDDVLTKTYERLVTDPAESSTIIISSDAKSKAKKRKPAATKKPYEGLFKAKIINEEGKVPRAEVTDLRKDSKGDKKVWMEDLECLKCRSKLL